MSLLQSMAWFAHTKVNNHVIVNIRKWYKDYNFRSLANSTIMTMPYMFIVLYSLESSFLYKYNS